MLASLSAILATLAALPYLIKVSSDIDWTFALLA
jgi:hypothetical protein